MKNIAIRHEEMNPESTAVELDHDTLESVVGGGLSVGAGYSASTYGSATVVSCNGEGQYMEL